jgi:hypothetical protein
MTKKKVFFYLTKLTKINQKLCLCQVFAALIFKLWDSQDDIKLSLWGVCSIKYHTRQKILVRDKHTSLFSQHLNDKEKKFYTIAIRRAAQSKTVFLVSTFLSLLVPMSYNFFLRHRRRGKISWSVCPWQTFQPFLMFVSKAGGYPKVTELR